MAKGIIWTDAAKLSRKNILNYWYKRNGNKKYSQKLSKEFNNSIDYLKSFPFLGKKTSLENIRTLSCGHYSIFYLYPASNIVVLAICDTRRDPQEIISELIKSRNKL